MITVREYLNKKGYQYKETQRPSGLNAIMSCPYCHSNKEQSFAINLEHGAFKCFRENNCGVSGSFWQFQKDMGDEPINIYKDTFRNKSKEKVYERPKKELSIPKSKIIDYFNNRGLTIDTMKAFKIGQDSDDNTYYFPYFKDGILVDLKYRQVDSKKMWREKNAEPVLFNRDMCKDKESIVITEGEIDCMTYVQCGIDAVSVPSGVDDMRWIENEWEFISRFKKIYINMDQDEAGQKVVRKLATRLGEWRCYNVSLPKKDANECLIGGADKSYFKQAIELSEGFDIDELVRADWYEEQVIKICNDNDKINGIPTGLEGLDRLIRGWRGGEVTIWTGKNASGKSTMINQVIGSLGENKERVCLGSFEMPPERILRWMVLQQVRYSILNDEEIRRVMKDLSEYLYMVNIEGLIKQEMLFSVFEYGARKYGIKHFFIDSLMRIRFKNRDLNQEQTDFMSDLVAFAVKHDVHIGLVAHPRKLGKESYLPGKMDVSGTGNLTNLAHNVIGFLRVSDKAKEKAAEKNMVAPDNIMIVLKNREHGDEGEIFLRFDRETKRFREIQN